mmetsp:Transcript_21418/g.45155  ORF Transcript_21418/g.45155 Transcript_21418/m.45155 type:complete len:303 (-) Transcript_21418:167-1075(-)
MVPYRGPIVQVVTMQASRSASVSRATQPPVAPNKPVRKALVLVCVLLPPPSPPSLPQHSSATPRCWAIDGRQIIFDTLDGASFESLTRSSSLAVDTRETSTCRSGSNSRLSRTALACCGRTVRKTRSDPSRISWLSSPAIETPKAPLLFSASSSARGPDLDSDRLDNRIDSMPKALLPLSIAAPASPLAMLEAITPQPRKPTRRPVLPASSVAAVASMEESFGARADCLDAFRVVVVVVVAVAARKQSEGFGAVHNATSTKNSSSSRGERKPAALLAAAEPFRRDNNTRGGKDERLVGRAER